MVRKVRLARELEMQIHSDQWQTSCHRYTETEGMRQT